MSNQTTYLSFTRGVGTRGASILIALFYFLVCAMVGAVVLTAATVTTGQLAALEKSQQAYYSTTSAAELLRDALSIATCTTADGGINWTCTVPKEAPTGNLHSWLAQAATRVATSSNSSTQTLTITAPNAGNGSLIPVTAVMRMVATPTGTSTLTDHSLGAYSLYITLYTQTSTAGKNPEENYRLVCEIPAAILYADEARTTPASVTWGHAIIRKPVQTSVSLGGA